MLPTDNYLFMVNFFGGMVCVLYPILIVKFISLFSLKNINITHRGVRLFGVIEVFLGVYFYYFP